MSKVFKLNKAGVKAILKSDAVYSMCAGKATQWRQSAGDGYVMERRDYPERTGAAVYPGDADAYYDNLLNNTLEKVVRSK